MQRMRVRNNLGLCWCLCLHWQESHLREFLHIVRTVWQRFFLMHKLMLGTMKKPCPFGGHGFFIYDSSWSGSRKPRQASKADSVTPLVGVAVAHDLFGIQLVREKPVGPELVDEHDGHHDQGNAQHDGQGQLA